MSAADRPPARPGADTESTGAVPLQQRLDAQNAAEPRVPAEPATEVTEPATVLRPSDADAASRPSGDDDTRDGGDATEAREADVAADARREADDAVADRGEALVAERRPDDREGAPHPADEAEARVAFIREEARVTDVRRAEEETAAAEAELEARRKEEEEAREKADAAAAEAARGPGEAAGGGETTPGSSLSGASITSPGVGTTTEPRAAAVASRPAVGVSSTTGPAPSGTAEEHPEYLVAAAFAGAFLLARLLRRILD